MNLHRWSLWLLYSITLCVVVLLLVQGLDYYLLPLHERPRTADHAALKPSGAIGHGLGIVGTLLMLVLLLYSARKRLRFMQRWGNIRYWLNYHIWMGVTGPVLVIFHTAFKLGGIVSISFWCMVAVALSGVAGRYLYLQIPRSLSGHELSVGELNVMVRKLHDELRDSLGGASAALAQIEALLKTRTGRAGVGMLWAMITDDLRLRLRLMRVKSLMARETRLPAHRIREIVKLVKRRALLERRIEFLSQAQALLHQWHIFHKPFAVVMLIFMLIHVGVAIVFGYHWAL